MRRANPDRFLTPDVWGDLWTCITHALYGRHVNEIRCPMRVYYLERRGF